MSVSHRMQLGARELDALSSADIRCVITRSVGTDHIDVTAASRRGIQVKRVSYSPGSVADHAVTLMLMLLRQPNLLLDGNAQEALMSCGRELGDMTVGVIGPGRIGEAVISRLEGFGCQVMKWGRSPRSRSAQLSEVLSASDIVTLHVPLTPDTHHLIGDEELSLMKKDAFIVNTARGGLIDTQALIKALSEKRIAGAALDVVDGDPSGLCHAALGSMSNVIITPHSAYLTDHALRDIAKSVVEGYLTFKGEG
ncbi:MAG: D-lactate dehydrogenase VanH-D [Eggerthellaceae bacterium]|nr:D-lactate dehydrogenase VanH-D [Eggerthellaceae bacterium]